MRRLWPVVLCALLALAVVASAQASQLIDRNATGVKLAVNRKGQTMITYHAAGRLRHVFVFGAINALPPDAFRPQVQLHVDYSGGWGTTGKDLWQHFPNACRAYDGPAIPFLVRACQAPDGSYWALQSWQRDLPDLGFAPWLPSQKVWELHVSHWTGELAKLEVYSDWVYSHRFHQIFGRLTYRGQPVYGFKTNRYGARLDHYGRLIYIDTYNASAYGSGWRRENSFVTHNPTGMYCYGFYRFDPSKGGYARPSSWPVGQLRGPGLGEQYRVTTEGPGMTPDISVVIPALHDYDPGDPADVTYEHQMNGILDSLGAGIEKQCTVH